MASNRRQDTAENISDKYGIIPREFFQRKTITVAKELLGKFIIKKERNNYISGRIVETEAYLGDNDPACHAYRSVTPRNSVMFEDGGKIYVYFIYGNYYCFNIVTELKGTGSAVLIRAVEPCAGLNLMKKRRANIKSNHELTNGPAKFCMAFGIDRRHNGMELNCGKFFIADNPADETVNAVVTKRIGIREGSDYPYRFFIKNNPFVSNHSLNKEIISEITL
ncbi:MAG: DNA-3-methyladenine glycosylase [Ignavibacteria bacterium]|nr:DNA-3-methyladenine glycosylase [Ignavibacteria bacterium]